MPDTTRPIDEACFEARLRSELERRAAVTPAMLHSIDEHGRLISVSDMWLAKLGYTRDEVLGRPSSDFLTAESREYAVREVIPEFFRLGRCDDIQYQMVRKDGDVIDVLLSAVLDTDPVSNTRVSLAAMTDISALKQTRRQLDRDVEDRAQAEQRLRESETRYRLLADHSSDIIALLGPDGTRVYVSPACRALTGYEPEEMLTLRTGDSTHPDDVERVLDVLANQTEPVVISYRMRRKDGSYVWVETACKPIEIEGMGNLRLAVVRDIDARIRAEQRVQESENRYRFLAENSADLILLVASDGQRLYASPASKTVLGYEPEEMLAIPTRDAIHPDDLDLIFDFLARKPEDPAQADRTLTYRMKRKDGSYRWVETTGRAVDLAGHADQRLVIIRDIDERVQAEQRIKDSEARYRLLADNGTDMVFQLDRDFVRQYVSPACRELLGYEPEELIGINPVSMAHPEDAARLQLVFQTLMSGHADRHSIINRIRHRNGKWIWVEAQFRTMRDLDTGVACGIIGALRDISVRKKVEDELAEANRRLQTLAGQDSLTGLANRRAFDEALAREYRRAKREKKALGLIMIDVDRFKAFNDSYGHPAGDECLRQVGRAIADAICRPGDLAARYGGEEFAVLLPDTDEAGTELIAERVRQAVQDLALRHDANVNGVVTISAGAASLAGEEGDDSPQALVNGADQALYRAKDGGRNAVVRATSLISGAAPASQAVA